MRLARAALATLLLALTLATVSGAAEAPTRSEYVAQLERICKPGSEATQRAVHGVQSEVRVEQLRRAAPRVTRAKRIFAHTVSAIAKVARPAADRATLARWFPALHRETGALGRTAAALRADDVARFQRVWADFIHEANKANNVVVSFGFNYCNFQLIEVPVRRRIPILVLAALSLLALALALEAAGPAGAEQSGAGGVVVSFDGGISPRYIPRHRSVPISLNLAGSVRCKRRHPAATSAEDRGRLRRPRRPRYRRPPGLSPRPPAQRHRPPGPRPLPRCPRRPRRDLHRSSPHRQLSRSTPAPASSPSTAAPTAAPPSGSTPTRPRRRSPSSCPSTCSARAAAPTGS